jgi:hypothetical protein
MHRACKSRISKPDSYLCRTVCDTVLRLQWCQTGVKIALVCTSTSGYFVLAIPVYLDTPAQPGKLEGFPRSGRKLLTLPEAGQVGRVETMVKTKQLGHRHHEATGHSYAVSQNVLTGGALTDAQSLADQTGIGTPAIRLIVHPTTVRITTPIATASNSAGLCNSPRLTMSTVAPAGGCEDRKRSRTAPVTAVESVAAPTRARVTPSCRTLGLSSKPKRASERTPARIATACPIRVLCGLALRLIGDSKKRYAVGPKDGKFRGCPVKKAANPLTAMASAAATKA